MHCSSSYSNRLLISVMPYEMNQAHNLRYYYLLEGRPPSGTSANPTTTITSADVATDNYCRCCPVSSRSPLAFLAIRDSVEDVSPHRVTSGSPITPSLNVYDDDLILSACSSVSHISAPSRLIAIDPAMTRLQPTLACV